MRIVVLGLLVACKRDAAPPPPPPVVAPVLDAPPIDAAIDAAIDAPALDASAPGAVKGHIAFQQTTPANSPVEPVAGCTLTAVDDAQQSRTIKTDAKGNYRLELPAGTYELHYRTCMRGFVDCGNTANPDSTRIVVAAGADTRFDLTTHSCNKCLDARTRIATPDGSIAIDKLRPGDRIIVIHDGQRVVATAKAVQRIPTGALARRLVLADGRVVIGAVLHPLADGRPLGAIEPGALVDGARVLRIEPAPYSDGHAYDVLPSIDGAYLADGVPLRSTM